MNNIDDNKINIEFKGLDDLLKFLENTTNRIIALEKQIEEQRIKILRLEIRSNAERGLYDS